MEMSCGLLNMPSWAAMSAGLSNEAGGGGAANGGPSREKSTSPGVGGAVEGVGGGPEIRTLYFWTTKTKF